MSLDDKVTPLRPRVATERLEHQTHEQRPQTLAGLPAFGVEAEVVEHHPVEGSEGRLALGQERADLLIDGGHASVGHRLVTVPFTF